MKVEWGELSAPREVRRASNPRLRRVDPWLMSVVSMRRHGYGVDARLALALRDRSAELEREGEDEALERLVGLLELGIRERRGVAQ